MKIILLQDIKALGRRGDVRNVADGYARNFLLPRNLVRPATASALEGLDKEKAKIEKELEGFRAGLKSIEEETANKPLAFQIKVGEKGEVFSSVGAREIKEKLIEKFPQLGSSNLEVAADHIKELGKQEIEIKVRRTPKSGLAASGQVMIEILPLD